MNPIRHIRRIAGVLAGAWALLALAAAAPAMAMTAVIPPVLDPKLGIPGINRPPAPAPTSIHTVTRTVVAGGMPGWQITLIAVGAALLAATVAVLTDRARAARRHAVTAAA
jgi:hypothetical protein